MYILKFCFIDELNICSSLHTHIKLSLIKVVILTHVMQINDMNAT